MDILVGIVMLVVAIVFVGIALDAAHHKERLLTWRCTRTRGEHPTVVIRS